MRILVLEDEMKVQSFIKEALEQAGMVVDAVASLGDLKAFLTSSHYDVIVLDRLVKGDDALDALDDIRGLRPTVKILILSALAEVEERVKGLSSGADDYLGKPFHVAELIARLRSLTRRGVGREKGGRDTVIAYEDLRIDLEKQRVFRGEKKVDLTGREFRILCLLARSPGQVFSKMKILDQAWDLNHNPESNVVEVTIANLRAKIDKGARPLIQSRRGVGYWLGER